VLSGILEQACARAGELYTSLQSFSAQESIEYQASDHIGYLQDARTGMSARLIMLCTVLTSVLVCVTRNEAKECRRL
jgi:hypothetical protein